MIGKNAFPRLKSREGSLPAVFLYKEEACFRPICAIFFLVSAGAAVLQFVFVSIPMMEERQSKKRGYADYKRRTRMLLPIKKTVKK